MARKNRAPQIAYKVRMTDAGSQAMAIGKDEEGKVLLVKNAVPGDVIDVRIKKSKKKYAQAEPVFFHEYSQDRVEPRCIHFGVCGGCKWQMLDYTKQLEYKQNEVVNHLQRIGKVTWEKQNPIKGAQEIYEYRNKMEFSFSNAKWLTESEINEGKEITNKNALGFHIPGMWSKILDLEACYLQAEPSNTIRLAVKKYAEDHELEFFDVYNHSGLLRSLMIRTTSTGELMIFFQFFDDNQLQIKGLLDFINETFNPTSLLFAINTKANDSIYDLDIQTYAGKDHIMEEMEGLHFKIGPKSFYQTNSAQAYELYKLTRDFLNLQGNEVVYDLYTGTGTIAQFVSKNAAKVVGIEAVPEAIEAAQENAIRNGITNCTFYCGDMKTVFTDEFIEHNGKPDVIITDPPRDGMHPKVVEQLLKIAPDKIVYVSCNSATQARDLALLDEKYRIETIQAVDLFPQTHHIENIAVLIKK